MNANAKMWVERLRSGREQQGRFRLHQVIDGQDRYCCMGIAILLYDEVNGTNLIEEYGAGYALPYEVTDWYGLHQGNGWHGVPDPTHPAYHITLTTLNDRDGLSFSEIADVIESEPPGLFV